MFAQLREQIGTEVSSLLTVALRGAQSSLGLLMSISASPCAAVPAQGPCHCIPEVPCAGTGQAPDVYSLPSFPSRSQTRGKNQVSTGDKAHKNKKLQSFPETLKYITHRQLLNRALPAQGLEEGVTLETRK